MRRFALVLACLILMPVGMRANRRAPQADRRDCGIQQDGITLGYVDEDDDFAGHSQWPKYLTGRDEDGRKRWQFPAKLTYRPELGPNIAQPSSQIWVAVDVPGSGICLAVDAARTLSGVRVRDGKAVWKHANFAYAIAPGRAQGLLSILAAGTVYKGGCFAYTMSLTPKTAASVVYITARTGSIQPMLFGLSVWECSVLGDTLTVKTADKALHAYSVPALLASHHPLVHKEIKK